MLPPISGVSGISASPGVSGGAKPAGFGDAITKGLDSVANIEAKADGLVSSMAAGKNVQISDVMAATSKANLGMSIVNEIRTRGLEAYQSIINTQV